MLYYGSHGKLRHISNFQWFKAIQLEFSSCLLRETLEKEEEAEERRCDSPN